MPPLVSILIPCYNAQRWVAQAIESALAQTWSEKEVIVIDDGSTDASLEIIKCFGDRIRWETGPNRGGNVARNRLLELSSGEWLQYLDADDYLLPDKISHQMRFLQMQPDADVVYGPVTLEPWAEQESFLEPLPIPEPHDPWVLLARWYLPQTGASLWRKTAIEDVGGWNNAQPCCQEHELYLRLLVAGKQFSYSEHDGAVYRQWSEHTVCKRDKAVVHRSRLQIEQQAEDFLRVNDELTPERLWAINQARFEIARLVWQYHRVFAAEIMATVQRSQHDFVPGGNAGPGHYRMMYRVFGFRVTEELAALKRFLLAGGNSQPVPRAS